MTRVSERKKHFQHKITGELKARLEEIHLDVCEACGRVGRGSVYAVRGPYEKRLVASRR